MSTEVIKFSEHNLINDSGVILKADAFKQLPSECLITDEEGTSGVAEIENADSFLWIYAKCGRNKPYSKEVLNVKTSLKEDNPRSQDQAELRTQYFFIYDYDSGAAYLSGGTNFFKALLRKHVSDMKFRNVYKSREEFLSSLRKVSKVRMVAKENLFSKNDTIFSIPGNELGLGDPTQLKLDIKFPHVKPTEGFFAFIKEKLANGCETGVISSLVVAGDCEEGDRLVESTFNLKKIESSIVVSAQKDDSGLFDPKYVKEQLLLKIS